MQIGQIGQTTWRRDVIEEAVAVGGAVDRRIRHCSAEQVHFSVRDH